MTMNREIDSRLTPYLDGELAPGDRSAVEDVLRSDPTAAEGLAALTTARDAVRGLGVVPAGADLSAAVVARLKRGNGARRVDRARWTVGVVLTAAASVGIAFALATWRRPVAVRPLPPTAMPKIAARIAPTPILLASSSRPPRPVASIPSAREAIRPEVLVAETRLRDGRNAFRELLGQGQTQRIDLVVDDLGAELGVVDAIVRDSPRLRPEFAKLHLVQRTESGGSARSCVYVLVMDEHELKKFRAEIDGALADSVGETAPAQGDALAALGTVGHIEVVNDGKAIASLMPPPADLRKDYARLANDPSPARVVVVDANGVVVGRPAEPDRAKPPPPNAPGPVPVPDEPVRSVYLVWISPRDRPRS